MTTTATPREMNQALEKANAIRVEMADYKRRCKAGEIDMREAIRTCEMPISIGTLICAFERYGKVRAAKICRLAGLSSDGLRMGGSTAHGQRRITPAERARVIAALDGIRYEPTAPVAWQADRLREIESRFRDEVFRRMCDIGCTPKQIAYVTGLKFSEVADRVWAERAA